MKLFRARYFSIAILVIFLRGYFASPSSIETEMAKIQTNLETYYDKLAEDKKNHKLEVNQKWGILFGLYRLAMRKVLLDRLLSGAGPEDFLPEVKKEIQEAVKDDALMLSVVESCSGTEKLSEPIRQLNAYVRNTDVFYGTLQFESKSDDYVRNGIESDSFCDLFQSENTHVTLDQIKCWRFQLMFSLIDILIPIETRTPDLPIKLPPDTNVLREKVERCFVVHRVGPIELRELQLLIELLLCLCELPVHLILEYGQVMKTVEHIQTDSKSKPYEISGVDKKIFENHVLRLANRVEKENKVAELPLKKETKEAILALRPIKCLVIHLMDNRAVNKNFMSDRTLKGNVSALKKNWDSIEQLLAPSITKQ